MRRKLLTCASVAALMLAPMVAYAQDGQPRAATTAGTGGAAGVQVAQEEAGFLSTEAMVAIGVAVVALGVGLGVGLSGGDGSATTTTTTTTTP